MQLIAQQLKQFILYLTVEKNASHHTVTSYLADIESFVEFARRQGVSEALFGHINPIFIRAYLSNLKAKGYSRNTIVRHMASLKSFCRFLVRENLIELNPLLDIRVPKSKKAPPTVLSDNEISQILEIPGSDALGQRDAAILELLYATGIRVSELTELVVSDIDLISRYILVYGKGTKERVVPVGRQAVTVLANYLNQARSNLYSRYTGLPHDKLFVNKNGGPLTDRSVRRIIAKYADCLAVSKKISPQSFRYTFAKHLINNGADFRAVQEMLGYVNLSTCLFELDEKREGLNLVYQHAHPRA